MCKKKCCPVWAVISVIFVLAAAALITVCVLKKLCILRGSYKSMDEGFWPEEDESKRGFFKQAKEEPEENGVRYTTDQDFVQ